MRVVDFPLLKITIWFILGILIGYSVTIPLLGIIVLFILFVPLAFVGYTLSNKQYKNHLLYTVSITFNYIGLGLFIVYTHQENNNLTHYTHFNTNKNTTIKLQLLERLKSTKTNYRYIAKIHTLNRQKRTGKVILNINKNTSGNATIGQMMLVHDKILSLSRNTNPGSFDYSKYLKFKNIYGQLYANKNNSKLLPYYIKDYRYYTNKYRQIIQANLLKENFPKAELAVLNALVLGQQQDIDKSIVKTYQDTGVIHILSVSGLHVGIIVWLFSTLVNYLPKNKATNYSKLVLLLIAIWSFAALAGLAPSVIRACVMFSFFIVGNNLNRTANIYNTIVASLLVILIFEPAYLFDIGFQLSYLAVFSIISLHPLIEGLWTPKYKLLKYIWKLNAVSIAAQIGTLPISLYYFHQFPYLFFIANIIVIPLIEFIIMPLGALVVLLAYFNIVYCKMTTILAKCISFMNLIIYKLAAENRVVTHIAFTADLVIISYLILIFSVLFLTRNSYKSLLIGLLCLITGQCIYIKNLLYFNKNELVVFQAKKQTLIAYNKHKKLNLYTNTVIPYNTYEHNMIIDYMVANHLKKYNLKEIPNVLYHCNKRILIINHPIEKLNVPNVEIIIISKSPKINLERIIKQYKPELIIADGSNYSYLIKQYQKTCIQLKIPFHNTYEKGALILK